MSDKMSDHQLLCQSMDNMSLTKTSGETVTISRASDGVLTYSTITGVEFDKKSPCEQPPVPLQAFTSGPASLLTELRASTKSLVANWKTHRRTDVVQRKIVCNTPVTRYGYWGLTTVLRQWQLELRVLCPGIDVDTFDDGYADNRPADVIVYDDGPGDFIVHRVSYFSSLPHETFTITEPRMRCCVHIFSQQ